MSRELITLVLLAFIVATFRSDVSCQSDNKMAKALEELIYAAPEKFERFRSSSWRDSWGGKAADVKKVGIVGTRMCFLYDKPEGIVYACFMDNKDARDAQKQVYDLVKRNLPQVLNTWRFKEVYSEWGYDRWDFVGGPNGCPLNDIGKCPIVATFACPKDTPNTCNSDITIRSHLISAADLPTSANKKTQQNARPCNEVPGFAGKTVTVVVAARPEPGTEWKYPEAPADLAAFVVRILNQNSRNIVFKEASGVRPDFYFDVYFGVTTQGTRQSRARAEIRPAAAGMLEFRESSGDAAFTEDRAAIEKLAANLLRWFEEGWARNPPCLRKDGSLRVQ